MSSAKKFRFNLDTETKQIRSIKFILTNFPQIFVFLFYFRITYMNCLNSCDYFYSGFTHIQYCIL